MQLTSRCCLFFYVFSPHMDQASVQLKFILEQNMCSQATRGKRKHNKSFSHFHHSMYTKGTELGHNL